MCVRSKISSKLSLSFARLADEPTISAAQLRGECDTAIARYCILTSSWSVTLLSVIARRIVDTDGQPV